jgi:L-malate glycosyltransferase
MSRNATHNGLPSVFLMANTFEIGGTERQFLLLSRTLDRSTFCAELGCMNPRGALREEMGEVSSYPFGGNVWKLRSWQSRLALARHLRSRRISIAHSFDYYPNLMLIPAARLAGTPVIIGSQRQIGDLLPPALFRIQRLVFRLCHGVVCNSEAGKSALTKRGVPERKITVIPNGLAAESFAETAPAFPRDAATFRVGMIARMNNPVKNYPGLLRAAARLARKFPNLEFLLAGDGPLRPELERQARELGLASQVHFLGDRQDIPALLASLDIVVSTSLSESLSNSVMEAMAASLPVVATRVGGSPELVRDGETGLLIPPNDDASLASAIERLLTHPELRAAFGSKARKFALERFSAASVVRQYEELYLRLLGERGKHFSVRSSVVSGPSVAPDRNVQPALSPRTLSNSNVTLAGPRQGRDREAVGEGTVPGSQNQNPHTAFAPRLLGGEGTAVRGSPVACGHRIKVAMVAPSLRFVGGQSAQAALLLRKWKGDPEVAVRFVPIDPDFPRVVRWIGGIPYLRTVARIPFYFWALWRAMADADVAHIFSASYWSFLLAPAPAILAARLRGAEALVNYHSGEAKDHLTHWRTATAILRRADSLVVPSQYLADVFSEFGFHAHVAPNCIDASQFHFRLRRPLRPRLVCTRGFGVYYSVHLVVLAFARVKRTFSDASLILAGVGSEEARVRKLVRDLNLHDVEFTGPVAWEAMATCYDRADIFINASWLDNMPISILEAFASGNPVVSTEPEGIRYLVRHEETGLLSEPGHWEPLAQHVIRLLQEPALATRLAQNGYRESMKYGWEAVRAAWMNVYAPLVGRSAKPPLELQSSRMTQS